MTVADNSPHAKAPVVNTALSVHFRIVLHPLSSGHTGFSDQCTHESAQACKPIWTSIPAQVTGILLTSFLQLFSTVTVVSQLLCQRIHRSSNHIGPVVPKLFSQITDFDQASGGRSHFMLKRSVLVLGIGSHLTYVTIPESGDG